MRTSLRSWSAARALDGGGGDVVEGALEDLAKAAGAEEVVLGEVVGGSGEFLDGEDLRGFTAIVVSV